MLYYLSLHSAKAESTGKYTWAMSEQYKGCEKVLDKYFKDFICMILCMKKYRGRRPIRIKCQVRQSFHLREAVGKFYVTEAMMKLQDFASLN